MSAAAKVTRLPVTDASKAIATELRGMAGELMARSDVAREKGLRMNAYDAAWVLMARADELEGVA